MSKDEKNHQAYMDVLDCKSPSMPNDTEYMTSYNFWYPLGGEAMHNRDHENDRD